MLDSTPAPTIATTSAEPALLRTFEPIVRFTHGEHFFPMDVERYVEASSLWLHHADGRDEEVVPEGSLTPEELVRPRDAPVGSQFYLRFLGPLGLRDSAVAIGDARKLSRQGKERFHAGVGRLARGGILPRVADGLFAVSLLVRGNVPGATAAAARLKYAAMQQAAPRFVYHGRVVRQGGWTVCQYWFFFPYNDWRTGFHGVNDHEADWEMVSVYLYEDAGRMVPEWVAFASHDFHGADLRRRWDDRSDLELVGDHPVVNAAAGSHASYFRPGEYQAEITIRLPGRLRAIASAIGRLWRRTLGQGGHASARRIPYIDFARADGVAIGPGQEREWQPVVIDADTPWVARYRGMWGLYARDPISGENAPGGPMYERDGTPRPAWFDPLGFAGLDVMPPSRELAALQAQDAALRARWTELDTLIAEETEQLQQLGSELGSLSGATHLRAEHRRQQQRVAAQSTVVTALLRERAETGPRLDALARRIERARAGRADGPRDHIRQPMEPVPPEQMRFRRAAEIWAAVSVSALLLGVAAVLVLKPAHAGGEVVIGLLVAVVVDSLLRRTYTRVINGIAVVLALISTVVLLLEFAAEVVIGVLIAFAAFLLFHRVREIRS